MLCKSFPGEAECNRSKETAGPSRRAGLFATTTSQQARLDETPQSAICLHSGNPKPPNSGSTGLKTSNGTPRGGNMLFRRIKDNLQTRREEYLLAFEITHFVMDFIIVIHIVMTM